MPRSILWASTGGTSPRAIASLAQPNHHNFKESHPQDQQVENCQEDQEGARGGPVWVKGSTEEDKERYNKLMAYMEEMRQEMRDRRRADDERKAEARKKEEMWTLMRMCTSYLKDREGEWSERRLKECSKIREEEKLDRLALVRVKKLKYGIKKASKEEGMRMKKRTEERLEISKAKGNLWKKYRERKKSEEEPNAEVWEDLRRSVIDLEEEGWWREEGEEDLRNITFIKKRKLTQQESDGHQEGEGEGEEHQGRPGDVEVDEHARGVSQPGVEAGGRRSHPQSEEGVRQVSRPGAYEGGRRGQHHPDADGQASRSGAGGGADGQGGVPVDEHAWGVSQPGLEAGGRQGRPQSGGGDGQASQPGADDGQANQPGAEDGVDGQGGVSVDEHAGGVSQPGVEAGGGQGHPQQEEGDGQASQPGADVPGEDDGQASQQGAEGGADGQGGDQDQRLDEGDGGQASQARGVSQDQPEDDDARDGRQGRHGGPGDGDGDGDEEGGRRVDQPDQSVCDGARLHGGGARLRGD